MRRKKRSSCASGSGNALLLDRVLRGEHEERLGQLARRAVDRHLLLGHRLEERRLRLRHRAVDLVDEEHVREHRARAELEVAVALVEDGEPGDIGRLQVGRALDPRERGAFDAAGDRTREHGLRRAGHVLQQDMTSADECGQDEPDLLGLAAHDRLDVREQPRRRVGGRAHGFIRLHQSSWRSVGVARSMIGALSSVDRASSSGEQLRFPDARTSAYASGLPAAVRTANLASRTGVRRKEIVTLLETSRSGKQGAEAHDDLTRRGTLVRVAEVPRPRHRVSPLA